MSFPSTSTLCAVVTAACTSCLPNGCTHAHMCVDMLRCGVHDKVAVMAKLRTVSGKRASCVSGGSSSAYGHLKLYVRAHNALCMGTRSLCMGNSMLCA